MITGTAQNTGVKVNAACILYTMFQSLRDAVARPSETLYFSNTTPDTPACSPDWSTTSFYLLVYLELTDTAPLVVVVEISNVIEHRQIWRKQHRICMLRRLESIEALLFAGVLEHVRHACLSTSSPDRVRFCTTRPPFATIPERQNASLSPQCLLLLLPNSLLLLCVSCQHRP